MLFDGISKLFHFLASMETNSLEQKMLQESNK
jgi:hypothetical protein